jgi:hypothetical protein
MVLISKGFQGFQKRKIPTFMDSRANNIMFVSKDAFTEYKAVAPQNGDLAKAENGGFEIISKENIVQHYQVDGKERKITYTHALYTPMLNANLVSVSVMDKAKLTTIFGNRKGVIQKANGTVILARQNVNGMYLLKTVNNSLNVPVAMTSLSPPTSFKQ